MKMRHWKLQRDHQAEVDAHVEKEISSRILEVKVQISSGQVKEAKDTGAYLPQPSLRQNTASFPVVRLMFCKVKGFLKKRDQAQKKLYKYEKKANPSLPEDYFGVQNTGTSEKLSP